MQPGNLNTQQTLIYIRNMICDSCIKVVQWELERTGFIQVHKVSLGEALISYNAQVISLDIVNAILQRHGFSIIDDSDARLVEQIKASIIQLIFFGNNTNTILRNSDFLSQKLDTPYYQLSKVFSAKTGTTLEKYIIQLKIEKVKELISYDELSLSEISYMMGYSSVQYLSNQFRQITGLTVQEYKKQNDKRRIPLNKITESKEESEEDNT